MCIFYIRVGGSVYYQIYKKNDRYSLDTRALSRLDHILTRVRNDVTGKGGISTFDPTWVLVVTWEGVLPRVNYDPNIDLVSHHLRHSSCHMIS